MGHCFVKRLRTDLRCKFDNYDAVDFNLSEAANVSLYGIRGLTVPRLAQEFRLKFANEPLSRIIILEIGRNDLSSQSPKAVIRELLDSLDHNHARGTQKQILPNSFYYLRTAKNL